jgi:hypothetical protein
VFPASPISPSEFLEGYVAAAFAEFDLSDPRKRLDLCPLEAFPGGRISVAGDMLLVMQLQAIALAAGEGARAGP